MVIHRQRERAVLRIGVAHHIGQRFLGDAINRHLDRGRKRWEVLRGVERDGQTRLSVVCQLFAEGWDETELIEGWRTQFVDQATDVGDSGLYLGLQVDDQGISSKWITFEQVTGGVELKSQTSEDRTQPIMQVAAQAAALLFAGGDKIGTRLLEFACQALQICGEPHCVRGYSSLPVPDQRARHDQQA